MFDLSLDKFALNDKKIKELQIQSDEQEAQFERLLHEHQVSKESLLLFLADPTNFDEETWKKMQHLRVELDKEVQTKLEVKNICKTKQTYQDLDNARKWIMVR